MPFFLKRHKVWGKFAIATSVTCLTTSALKTFVIIPDTRQKVADGLAQLDRGEGLDGESVMARLKERVRM